MGHCDKKIKNCVEADCNKPNFSGVESKAWIFNKEDVTIHFDENDGNVIDSITNIGTTHGYTITQFGKQPYNGTSTTMVEGNAGNKFTNTLSFIVPDNSHTASNTVIDNLANGKFVVVIENSYAGSDDESAYQVYGSKKALTASAIENDKYSEETDGGWQITLTEENTPISAAFLLPTLGTGQTMRDYMSNIAPDCAN